MSTFADFLIEFGPQRREGPAPEAAHRAGAWTEVQGDFGSSRLYLSVSNRAGARGFASCEARGMRAWVMGEVYAYNGVPAATGPCVVRFLEDLAGSGAAKPESLCGRFLILVWSQESRNWTVWTDRMGSMQAFFVASNSGELKALGSYSPAVYAYSSRQFDWTGLSSFFALGFFIEDRTHYEDCRILRPAVQTVFHPSGRRESQQAYWQWRHNPDPRRNEADTIAEFAERFARVVDLQTRDCRTALPLSGGLDSRTVAACIPQGRTVASYSYGYTDGSVETAISREVAAAAGLRFHGHTIRPYLFDKLDLVLESVEGYQDLTQSRQADVSEWLEENSDVVIGAHWGDVLCDEMGVEESAPREVQLHKLESKMLKNGGDWLLSHLCGPHVASGETPRQLVRASLEREWAGFDHIADADFRIKTVKSAQWAFRWTLPSIRMYQAGSIPRLPFLDPSLLDFFCTTPTSMVRGRRLQIEYLKRFAPHLARVRWQAYDADLYHYHQFGTWQLPRRAVKAVARALTPGKRLRRNWEVQFLHNQQLRDTLRDWLCGNNLVIHELMDPKAIRTLYDGFLAKPDAANGYRISMLLTFSAWAQRVHAQPGVRGAA